MDICKVYVRDTIWPSIRKKMWWWSLKSKEKTPKIVPSIFFYSTQLKIVYQFKYLGYILTSDLKDDTNIEKERRSLSVRVNMLARRFAKCSNNIEMTVYNLMHQFLHFNMWVEYSQKSYKAFRVQYNNAYGTPKGLPSLCNASRTFSFARMGRFYATMRERWEYVVRRLWGATGRPEYDRQ